MDFKKIGLDYFSFNVDFFEDPKIDFIGAKYGIKGELIVVRLLCKIYKESYYIKWSEDDVFMMAKKTGGSVSADEINRIISDLLRKNFFNMNLFEKFGVLTSSGIQKRYFFATERRKKVQVIESLLLTDISKYKNIELISNTSIHNVDISDTECIHDVDISDIECIPDVNISPTKQKGKEKNTDSRVRISKTVIKDSAAAGKNLIPKFQTKKDLQEAAAKAMFFCDENLDQRFVEKQSKKLAAKMFEQQPIKNLNAYVSEWLERIGEPIEQKPPEEIPPPIIVDGKKHIPKLNGNGYVYPTIKGKIFNDEKTKVQLLDGTWQQLSDKDQQWALTDAITPEQIYKGKK